MANDRSEMDYAAERLAFFAALGLALDRWSLVENRLYMIFRGCVSPPEPEVAAAIYFATESFRTKLNLTNAALRTAFRLRHDVIAEWEKLHKALRERSLKRNELAHHEAVYIPTNKPGHRIKLVEQALDPHRRDSRFELKDALGPKELEERGASFDAVAERLLEFHLTCGKGAFYYVKRTDLVATLGEPQKP